MGFMETGTDSFDIIFIIIAVLTAVVFIFALVSMIGHRRLFKGILRRAMDRMDKDDHAPRLTVPATVVSKRSDVTMHHHGGDTMHHQTAHTSYYVTFQVQSGDRMELWAPAEEYGLLVEGDEGDLTFQGSRFLRFERRWGG